jgi:hypothetical protein
MNFFRKLKLLKLLKNKDTIFYQAKRKWYFETVIDISKENEDLIHEWLYEKKGGKKNEKK